MEHKITLTQTGDEWQQKMVCEFADATIVTLIMEDAHTSTIQGRPYLYVAPSWNECVAKLEPSGSIIIVTCKNRLSWDADPSANKQALSALAQHWHEQEQVWLPIARYFSVIKDQMERRLSQAGGYLGPRPTRLP